MAAVVDVAARAAARAAGLGGGETLEATVPSVALLGGAAVLGVEARASAARDWEVGLEAPEVAAVAQEADLAARQEQALLGTTRWHSPACPRRDRSGSTACRRGRHTLSQTPRSCRSGSPRSPVLWHRPHCR